MRQDRKSSRVASEDRGAVGAQRAAAALAARRGLLAVIAVRLVPAAPFAVVNLVRAELLQQRFRQLQRQVAKELQLPPRQRRRLRLIRWTSVLVLVIVAVEGVLRVAVMKIPLL
jgi:hypothetical protein